MTAVPLDTHEVVKELMAAGFTDEQAEAVTRVVRKAQNVDLSALATKADIATLRSDIDALRSATKSDLQVGLAEMRAEIQGTRADLLKWMVGTVGVQTVIILGTVVALVRLLPH